MEPCQRLHLSVQGARPHSAIQSHSKAGSVSRRSITGFIQCWLGLTRSHVLPPSVTELSHMFRASANSVLQAAAKSLAWDLYAAAAYCRTRRYVDVENFKRECLSPPRQGRE